MQHICTLCVYCKSQNACVDCSVKSLQHYYEIENDTSNSVRIIASPSSLELMEFPYEIERIGSHKLRVSHPYFNCSEVNLIPLLQTAYDANEGHIDADPEINTVIMTLLSKLIYEEDVNSFDLLKGLIHPSNKEISVHAYDSRKGHLLTFESIFRHFSNGEIFIADIHDLTHHGTQTSYWNDFVIRLGIFGSESYKQNDEIKKSLSVYLLYACLEYSIVKGQRNPYSAGCLNWQNPRKSPAELAQFKPMCGKCISEWNAFRGVVSLYRRQEELALTSSLQLDWFNQLGYGLPSSIVNTLKLNGYNSSHRSHVQSPIPKIKAPRNVKDLLMRGDNLMKVYA